MANIVTANNGVLYTTETVEDISKYMTDRHRWIMVKPSGTLVNLQHVVMISDIGDITVGD